MKVIHAILAIFLSLTLCQAQDGRDPGRAPDEDYTAQLVSLIEGLQKNPWQGWKPGTVVVIRYFGDRDPAMKSFANGRPDLVFTVLDDEKFFTQTQTAKGKPFRRDFLIKDQPGLEAPRISGKEGLATDIEIDGFKLTSLLSSTWLEEFPGGTSTFKEWSLAGHASILLRKEVNDIGWRVTSATARKMIGEREFRCVEIKRRMRIYTQGTMDVLTTQYLSPEVPGHLVEQIEEFVRVGGRQKNSSPEMVIHQKVVEIKHP